jgi:23S rRNA G2445 N2-methylase RlmL
MLGYNVYMIYKLTLLEGTLDYVEKELLLKYPDIKIQSKSSTELVFESEIRTIETFRNLYSPTHVENTSQRINISDREWRLEYVPAGINPSLAYIMCMIADLKEKDIVYDPFCGASVIPITALKYFNVKRVICSDISGNAIDKSKRNFYGANIDGDKYKLFGCDIKKNKLSKQNIDKIVSNLPFGIRVGNHEDNKESYKALEVLAKKILRTKGKMVLLTQEKVLLREVFKKEDWNVISVMRVNEGGLLPEVFEITKI